MDWIRSLRPTTTVRLGIVTLIGFWMHSGGLDWEAWILSAFVTLGASATMALNDWFDREHDLKKGKNFAHLKGSSYMIFVMSFWLFLVLVSFVLWAMDLFYGAVGLSLLLIGFFYSFSRHFTGLPAVLVALASSLPVLLPLARGPNLPNAILFVVLFFFTFGRELLKDMGDLHDRGYKKTIPVAIGNRMSKKVVAMTFTVVLAGLFFVSRWAFFVVPAVVYAIWLLLEDKDHNYVKKLMDYATIPFFVLLIF